MTDKNEFGRLLADNLKALNAKERDHLMRFAYLGEKEEYEKTKKFLSQPFFNSMKEALGGNIPQLEEKDCLFAGMDYHIDWLHAAMFMAGKEEREVAGAVGDEFAIPSTVEISSVRKDGKPCKIDLRPVTGIQEDIDLLVVFNSGGKTHVVFIEAKGTERFDRKQLVRKLVRVNHVIRESRPESEGGWKGKDVEFYFVLATARDVPDFTGTFMDYINESDANDVKEIVQYITNDCGRWEFLDEKPHWLKVGNFPKPVMKVTRIEEGNRPEEKHYSKWTLEQRS